MATDRVWRGLVLRDGRLRGVWRLLLFGAAFSALSWLFKGLVPVPEGVRGSLVWQGALVLTAAVVAGIALLRIVDGRPASALGFAWRRRTAADVAVGFALGAAAVGTAVLVAVMAGTLRYEMTVGGSSLAYLGAVAAGLAILALPAAAEESLFRGYPYQTLVESMGPVGGTVVFSGAFAVAHGANPAVSALALANIFLAGIMLSVAYLRTRSLWFATAVHLGWNWAVALPLDLPVSGLNAFDAPLYEPVTTGPAWIAGGDFGPEGGLVGTLGFALAFVMIWRWTRNRPAPGD